MATTTPMITRTSTFPRSTAALRALRRGPERFFLRGSTGSGSSSSGGGGSTAGLGLVSFCPQDGHLTILPAFASSARRALSQAGHENLIIGGSSGASGALLRQGVAQPDSPSTNPRRCYAGRSTSARGRL